LQVVKSGCGAVLNLAVNNKANTARMGEMGICDVRIILVIYST